ncbi:MAG: hypothetical protein Kow0088_10200 [Anaerolineales bacterium]
MKTQILQLEVHDDVISIIDKIEWAQTERVLLVFPRRRRILNHKLDLLRLKRHSQKKGCQLALVSEDSLIKALAREIGLPTFNSIQKAHNAEWKTNKERESHLEVVDITRKRTFSEQHADIQELRQELKKPLPFWSRIAAFFLATLAVISILAVLIHSAVIRLNLPTHIQSAYSPIIATNRVQQARLSGEVPISTLSLSIGGTKTIKASGSITLPKDFAKGEVLLTNLTDQTIEVPPGTIVRTIGSTPKRYATQKTIFLKPGNQNSQVVQIQALEAGSTQNASPHEIKAVEGVLGLKISVKNTEPIRGGSNLLAPAPNEQDRKMLFQSLQSELIEQAKKEILQKLEGGDLLLPDSAIQTRVIRQQYSPNEFTASDFLTLNLEIEVTFRFLSHQSLEALGNQLLASSLPSGYQPVPNSFSAICLEPFQQLENGDYHCNGVISWQIIQSIDPEKVRSLVSGRSIISASQRLQEIYNLPSPPNITIFPSWAPLLPWLPMRIQIALET